jgi:hypothetical protein
MVHDVGMQARRWGDLLTNDGRPLWDVLGIARPEPMSPDEVRQAHIANGEALLLAEVDGTRNWSAPPPFCSDTQQARDLLLDAVRIAFAHSRGARWDECSSHSQDFDPIARQSADGTQDYSYRPRLLVGILRLCDELDGTEIRIDGIERLLTASLPDESRYHWLSCYFIHARDVVIRERIIEVSLAWRVPNGLSRQGIERARTLLAKMREARIYTENTRINRMYEATRSPGWDRRVNVSGLANEPRFTAKFPPAHLPLLERTLEQFEQDQVARQTPATRAASVIQLDDDVGDTLIGKSITFAMREDDDSSTLEDESPIATILRQWYFQHRQSQHVELVNGEHTDTYLHCRRMISDQPLLDAVTDELVASLAGRGVSQIVAVGTTAIALATNLGLRLDAGVTFTFFREGITVDDELHLHYEVRPALRATTGGVTLVLDDVIAGGGVARAVIGKLIGEWGLPNDLTRIVHVSLFRLGRRPIDLHIEYSYLCHVPEVYYAASRGDCMLCAADVPFVKELSLT